MPIRTKRIYDLAELDDGYRLLIMRLWPRGVRKDRVSEWQPELGPSRPLLKALRSRTVDWGWFLSKADLRPFLHVLALEQYNKHKTLS